MFIIIGKKDTKAGIQASDIHSWVYKEKEKELSISLKSRNKALTISDMELPDYGNFEDYIRAYNHQLIK